MDADQDIPSFPTIDSVPSLRERVYDAIEEIVVTGVVEAGSHLREDDLAVRLGVSRNPVRESLQRLVHEGLADHVPGRGVFVHTPTMHEIEDVFQARALLEVECARLAATRITDAELQSLDSILAAGAIATTAPNARELLQLNEAFHGVILDASGNVVIDKIMDSLSMRVRWYFSSVVSARAVDSWKQHQAIFHALQQRDSERVVALMTTHISDTLHALQVKWPST